MDIKLKKSKIYNLALKRLAVTFIIFSSFVNFCSGIIINNIIDNWGYEIIDSRDVFDTEQFYELFTSMLDKIVLTEVHYQSEKNIRQEKFVDCENLIVDFKKYYDVVDNYVTENVIINKSTLEPEIIGVVPKSLESSFNNYINLINDKFNNYKLNHIEQQLSEYKKAKLELEEIHNLYYSIENSQGDVIASNASKNELNNSTKNFVLLSSGAVVSSIGNGNYLYENSLFEETGYTLYVGIREPFYEGGQFFQLEKEYRNNIDDFRIMSLLFISSSVVIVYLFCYLIYVAGQSSKDSEIKYFSTDKVYTEIHFLIVIALLIYGIYLLSNGLNNFVYTGAVSDYFKLAILTCYYIMEILLVLYFMTSIARQVKGGILNENSIFTKAAYNSHYVKDNITIDKNFRWLIIGSFLIYGIVNSIIINRVLYNFGHNNWLCLLGIVIGAIFNKFFISSVYIYINSVQIIMRSVNEISRGNLECDIEIDKVSPILLGFANDVSNIQNGFKLSNEEAVKSERAKSELIANVSHDLKTPLTSLISYIDILKHIDVSSSDTEKYIGILHDKAYRLKQLIDDLIEASRVSSGTLTMIPIKLDYNQMCLQCVGELEDKITEASLEVVVNSKINNYIYADGRHLARIIENLLTNAIKYSSENSRINIEIYEKDNKGYMNIKNKSGMKLDFTKEQAISRFFRGDDARSTDGTGLGLSIAESLTKLQKGEFDIIIDGEFFKAVVSMPLYIEDNEDKENIENTENSEVKENKENNEENKSNEENKDIEEEKEEKEDIINLEY